LEKVMDLEKKQLAEGHAVHTMRMYVHFGDVDHAGILYYPKLFHYAHLAYEDFLRKLPSWSLPSCFNLQGVGTPVVSAEASFHGPLAHGEKIAIEVVVERVGQRSFTLGFRLCDDASMSVRARIRVIHAIVSQATFQSIPIPDELREFLEKKPTGAQVIPLANDEIE